MRFPLGCEECLVATVLLLLLLAPGGVLGVIPPCSDGAAMGEVSSAATAMLGSKAYVFPGNKCKGDKKFFYCHYECDASGGTGAQWKPVQDVISAERNVTQSITWQGPAAAAGALPNGTEVIFMVGGGTRQNPCNVRNPNPDVCKGFKVFVAYNPSWGIVELPSRGAPELALATAAFVGHTLYVIGGTSGSQGMSDHVYRFDTTSMRWIEPFRGAGVGGSPFTPRYGLSSVVIGNTIFTVGGVELQASGSSSYSTVVDILDLGRAGTAPGDIMHAWHKGPDALSKRAYATAFTMGCKVYVAGGAKDGGTQGSTQNLDIVEIYSVASGKTLAEGSWVEGNPLAHQVSHAGAIVPAANAARQEAAVVIGGLSGGDPGSPKSYCQSVPQPCADPSRPAHKPQYEDVSCSQNQCARGYVNDGAGQCEPCPGTDPLGSCGNGGCGGAFQTSGLCSWNSTAEREPDNTLLERLTGAIDSVDAGHPQCTCTTKFSAGKDCQSCASRRAGSECEKCEPGRYGPECKACPGLIPPGGGKDDPSAVCGGLGPDTCDGAGDVRPSSGACECPYRYDDATNCTTCAEGFWGLDQGCIECSCTARLMNATAKSECPASAVCGGHGHCKGDDVKSTVCVCDSGYTGPDCTTPGGGLGGGTIFACVLIGLGSVGAVFIWRKNLRGGDNDDELEAQAAPLTNPVNAAGGTGYGSSGVASVQNDYPPATMSAPAPMADGDLNESLLKANVPRDDQADAMFASLMQGSAASGQANYDQAGAQ